LFSNVLADHIDVEADGGDCVASSPEVFSVKVALLALVACDGNGTLALEEADHRGDGVLGRNGDAHMHVITHEVAFDDGGFLLPGQFMENGTKPLAKGIKDRFLSVLGNEDEMIFTIPFGMR